MIPVLLVTWLSGVPTAMQSSVSHGQTAYISGVAEQSEFISSEPDATHMESNNFGAPLLNAALEDTGVPLLEAQLEDTGVPLLDAAHHNDSSLCLAYADSAD
jgi:hypothetical protein